MFNNIVQGADYFLSNYKGIYDLKDSIPYDVPDAELNKEYE